MSIFKNIKGKLAQKSLEKESGKQRKAKICSLEKANSVAFIYENTSKEDQDFIRAYMKEIRSKYQIKETMALAFFEGKEVPEYLKKAVDHDFFSSKEIAWTGKPNAQSVQNFTNKPYDLLIDLSFGDCMPLLYVYNWSNSSFKVSRKTPVHEQYSDLMLDLSLDASLEEYLAYTEHYLKLMKAE